MGFPGLIATPLKKFVNLNFLITDGTKSNFPAETAPEGEAKKEEDGKEKSAKPSDGKTKGAPAEKGQSPAKEKETKKK